jgi:hypothetical protein
MPIRTSLTAALERSVERIRVVYLYGDMTGLVDVAQAGG